MPPDLDQHRLRAVPGPIAPTPVDPERGIAAMARIAMPPQAQSPCLLHRYQPPLPQ